MRMRLGLVFDWVIGVTVGFLLTVDPAIARPSATATSSSVASSFLGQRLLGETRIIEEERRILLEKRKRLEANLDRALLRLAEEDLLEIERALLEPAGGLEDSEGMMADAPIYFTNDTARAIKDSWDPVSGRAKEQRLMAIREQVLRFLGRKDNINMSQPTEQQAKVLQIISQIKIERAWPATEVYTELQSFYPSCELPRNTEEDTWEKGLQMNLFFNLNFTSPGQGATSIQYAKLRLYKLPQGNTTMPLTEDCHQTSGGGSELPGEKHHYIHFPGASSSSLPIEEKQIRVSVYWYTRGLRRHRVKRKLLDSQMISLYGESWTEYNVKAAVKAWKELGKNFGISVEVEDEDRVILQANKIFVAMNCSKDASMVGGPIPSPAVEGLDNSTREALRPLGSLYPVLELSTREFPESAELAYPGAGGAPALAGGGASSGSSSSAAGVRLPGSSAASPDHRLRHHHSASSSVELPQINDTMIGGFKWEDPRDKNR